MGASIVKRVLSISFYTTDRLISAKKVSAKVDRNRIYFSIRWLIIILGVLNGIFKFFGIYAILDLALIRSRYSVLLRHHEKTN
jgi:hypothetical protein